MRKEKLKKMYSKETNHVNAFVVKSFIFVSYSSHSDMNQDISINHNEYDDDPMTLLIKDGNGSISLTKSQKASLFDKIFSPDRQEDSKTQANIQYFFEGQSTNQPEIETESCLQTDLGQKDPAEEPAEEESRYSPGESDEGFSDRTDEPGIIIR